MRFLGALSVATIMLLSGCGGGGGGGGGSTPSKPQPPQEENVTPVKVGRGNLGIFNLPMVSVTVCAPGDASRCYVVDNILLDTGSIGLRLVDSALAKAAPNLVLPIVEDASGKRLYECVGFVDGSYTWGGVRRADVKIGGKVASNISVQIAGDVPASGVRPPSCTSIDASADLGAVTDPGVNGILGVNYWEADCGEVCENSYYATIYDNYYYFTCGNNRCDAASVPVASQVKNPVAAFASDNNGVIVDLPALSAEGSASVSGTLIFGINTRSNNALGSSTHMFNGERLITTYKQQGRDAFIDSGSNALFFDDLTIPRCPDSIFFCPATQQALSAVISDLDSDYKSTVNFFVANVRNLSDSNYAFNNVAGLYSPLGQNTGGGKFDWGLPFFFGRKVYFGMEGGDFEEKVGF